MTLIYRFYSFLLITSIFFSVTNLVPISILFFLALILLFPLLFFTKTSSLSKISFFCFLYLLYSFLSLLIYDPNALFKYEFYRYDGNFFVSFFPFIFLGLFKSKLNINYPKILKLFLFIALAVSLPFACLQLYINTDITGPFISTNAFGGFLISCLSVSLFLDIKKIYKFFLIALFIFLLFLTGSRGSIIGFALGVLTFYLIIKKRHYFFSSLIILSIIFFQISILMFTYPEYKKYKSEIISREIDFFGSQKLNNIYIRIYENWPRGLYVFLNAPIFGAGVGSVNDYPITFDNNKVVQFNHSENRIYNSAHTHNIYLHILAEQGIIGFILFISFLWIIFLFLINSKKASELRNILLLIYLSLIFASFSENRIVSPSNIFPFTLFFFLFYGVRVNAKKNYVTTINNHNKIS